MDGMLASVKIQVDCLGRPATVEISTVIRTGIDDLDLALFHAMTLAVRNLADEVNSDQERAIETAATQPRRREDD